jgi:hypothetical protein
MAVQRTTRQPKDDSGLGFRFNPEESTHHFLVTIPAGNRQEALISEHYTWDAKAGSRAEILFSHSLGVWC